MEAKSASFRIPIEDLEIINENKSKIQNFFCQSQSPHKEVI